MSTLRYYGSMPVWGILLLAAGCGSPSFVASTPPGSGDLMAVKVVDYSGADALAAHADAITGESQTVSLPIELTQDTLGEAVIALTPEEIAMHFDAEAAGRRNPTASVLFRIAAFQEDACTSDLAVGPVELTLVDGTLHVDPAELPIPAEALILLRRGRVAWCAETRADFDGTISLGGVAFETGRLHAREHRVKVCHVTPGEKNEENKEQHAHTITVGSPAVEAHLAHGDHLGECNASELQNVPAREDASDDHPDQEDLRGPLYGIDGDANGTDNNETHPNDRDDSDNADEDNSSIDDNANDTDRGDSGDKDPEEDVREADNSANAGGSGDADQIDNDESDEHDGDDSDEIDSDDSDENDSDSDDRERNDSDDSGGGGLESLPATDPDRDGVTNDIDQCPNTPVGETADVAGCSCSQKDADADGVNDCDDTCAGTNAGGSVDARGCAGNQLDDDRDGVTNDIDSCSGTPVGAKVDALGCHCSQLDADGDGVDDCTDTCARTPAGEAPDSDGCSISQLTAAATVPGPTDIYLAGQPDGTTATWRFTGATSVAPRHSPEMIDVSKWAGKELRFSATGVVGLGGNNAASPVGRGWVLRPNGLRQVFGLTAMIDFRHGALVGVFLTDAPPTRKRLPYMSSSGITTTMPLLQHVFLIGSANQVVIPKGATRLFFGVAEQQGTIIDNSGSFEVAVEAVPHALLPSDPLAATRFYAGNPNDPKDGIGWFDNGQWTFDYDFDGVADFTTTFGQAGDQPVVGDFNGDGLDEIGVMAASASGNLWVLDMNGNGVFDAGDASFTYGATAGAIAIAGDWDGDGTFELGFVSTDNLWHLDLNGDRVDGAGESLNAQYDSTAPVIGDWTGDGVSNLGNSTIGSFGWRFDLDNDRRWIWGTTYRDGNWAWGNRNLDSGVAGDWDGDGLDDPGRYRASTGDWHCTTRAGRGVRIAPIVRGFGANATPVAGSWATVRAAP